MKNLTELDLNFGFILNNWDNYGSRNLGNAVSKLHNLTSLNLNLQQNENIGHLAEGISKLQNLTILNLNLSYSKCGRVNEFVSKLSNGL